LSNQRLKTNGDTKSILFSVLSNRKIKLREIDFSVVAAVVVAVAAAERS